MPHTPGPWAMYGCPPEIAGPQEPYYFDIYGPNNEIVSGNDGIEGIGNAMLIAAAPDLLHALECIILADDEGADEELFKNIEAARATVAKAKGVH